MRPIWSTDTYAVLAGDVALNYAGRGYNVRTGRWETVSGGNLSPTGESDHILLSADIRVQTAAGLVKDGVYIILFVCGDPIHTGWVVPWFDGVQSKGHLVNWAGHTPMMGGLVWRIHASGLIATDVVSVGVSYV